MANSLLKTLPEKIAGDLPSLIDNVIAILFENDPARFLKAHYVPMDGAEQSLVIFEFDVPMFEIAFDAEFRATLRTMGFELPQGQEVIAGHVSHS